MAAPAAPVFIASDIFRTSRHASGHPLAIPRVSLTVDLCRALGWLSDPAYVEAPQAGVDDLCRFHAPDYVDAVIRAEATQTLPDAERRRFNLGVNGNPIYGEVFRRPATACGASLLGARLLAEGGVVHAPAGGTHHGLRDRASGYCIFNDPVLAIDALLAAGLDRIVYLDLDAHFGDGVQLAFADDERVLTVSLHEARRWPMRRDDDPLGGGFGAALDRAGGVARNLPLPEATNDSEFEFLVEKVVLPLVASFRAEAIVLQCGADALACDPMTRLALSNRVLWATVAAVRPLAPRLLVLGGGGYNPYATARCWAGVWATLSGASIPDRLPAAARATMASVRWRHRLGRAPAAAWIETLADARRPGPIREEVRDVARLTRCP